MDLSTIEIRTLATHAELQACVELQRSTWGESFSDVVPASILKVSQRIGGVVGDERAVWSGAAAAPALLLAVPAR